MNRHLRKPLFFSRCFPGKAFIKRTVLYRILFHHFERFLTEYESRFEKEYGFFRPIVKEVVERYLDCGNPRCGFARIRCPDCREERLSFMEPEGKIGYRYGHDGAKHETMDYLEFIARVTSHIPDKGQMTVRYGGLYANAHRGKVKKASLEVFPLRIVEEELRRLPAKGWAAMIRKVYEVDPTVCPKCGGTMKIIAFLTEHAVVDRIIDHLKLAFAAAKPPPPEGAFQELLMAADSPGKYFL